MTGLDESILEFMEALGTPVGEPVVVSPRMVKRNLEHRDLVEKSRSTYSRRMRKLADAGLLIRMDGKGAYYYISKKGVDWVDGNLSAEDLEDIL